MFRKQYTTDFFVADYDDLWNTIYLPPGGLRISPLIKQQCWGGEILRPPESSVPQTIVFRFKEIGGVWKIGKRLFSCQNILKLETILFSMFPTQYTFDFFEADHYGLWKTASGGESKDLASVAIVCCYQCEPIMTFIMCTNSLGEAWGLKSEL
jgi:hypothetical protein